MSLSPEAPKRGLEIETGVPTAEIFVIDGWNNVVARGVESVRADLPIGVYKVRFRVGNTVSDKLVELPEGEGNYIPSDLPELPIVSPVPLNTPGTQAQSPRSALAATWSNIVHVSHGTGSRVFLFVDAPAESSATPFLPGALTLRTFDGQQIASLAQGGCDQGCYGCTIEVAPGGYVLWVERGDSPAVCQTVYTAQDWQTQVFFSILQLSGFSTVDLSGCSMLMSPVRFGFRSDSRSFLWAEAARKTLASGRAGITPAGRLRGVPAIGVDDNMIEQMLDGKYLNPMLGIYGAHLMAAQDSPDNKEALREVVPNLEKLVGGIPDVTSLLLYLEDPRCATLTYPEPPMLAASWSLIVKYSTQLPNLVPAGSFSENIAGSLWGSGAWLGWKITTFESPAPPEALTEHDWDLVKRVAAGSEQRISLGDMNPVERAVMSYVSAGVKLYSPFNLNAGPAAAPDAPKPITPETTSTATGIPYSVVLKAVASLTKRFK